MGLAGLVLAIAAGCGESNNSTDGPQPQGGNQPAGQMVGGQGQPPDPGGDTSPGTGNTSPSSGEPASASGGTEPGAGDSRGDGEPPSSSNPTGGPASSAQAGAGGNDGNPGATSADPAGQDTSPTTPGETDSSAGPEAGPAEPRVDNPYADAQGYINPEWRKKAEAEPGGDRIANTPTAVWLDRIAAIEGTENSQSNGPMGVRDHLEAAVSQGADYIQFVIYNLPGRDCAALASNGELGPEELPRYKAEYIDPIASIMSDTAFRGLRIINIIEVDSLPNLVTNTDVQTCAQMKQNGGYVDGIAYALAQLGSLPNTYNYVDAGHHGWLGWETNFGPTAQLYVETGKKAGMENVHGFIMNTANYSALEEPHFDPSQSVGGMPVRQATWLDWNPYAEELSFAQAFRQELIAGGYNESIGMLIDTSRNGWGGPQRPAGPSAATDVDTFVNESRIDRRIHAGNWCNQAGAGLGERPRANPAPGIDAYAWIKPPGESDGSSQLIENSDGKGFDRMCDPTYGGNERNGNSATGALPNAPISGAWFSAQFQELMANAHPPL